MNKAYPSVINKKLALIKCMTFGLLLVLCLATLVATAQNDTLIHKRFGRAALLWSLTQMTPWTIDRYVRNVDWAHISSNTLKYNINPGSWAWDNDSFSTNQLGHPIHGSIFFNTFRSNGYSFWQSVPAAFAGSYVWETAAETQAPSINDFINTGFGGVVLGEALHRFSGRLIDNGSKGVKRQISKVLALVINPAGGLTRIMDGKWGKATGSAIKRDTTQINAEFDLGMRDFKVNNSDGNFGWYSHVKMRYGSPFENYKGAFNYIYANTEFGKDDTTAVNIVTIYGSLAGWRVALTDSSRHTSILTANFDYINNKAFFYSSESLRLNLFSEYRLPGDIKITTIAGLGPLFLATVPDPYLYQGRTYDYGTGVGGGLYGEIGFKGRFFYSLNYRGWWVKTLSGNSSEYFLHTVTSEFRYKLMKDFSICAEPGYFTLKGHFKKATDTERTYPYFRVSLRYAVSL
ncbi:MAG: DUF3943 domain-containing protein [Mucilaginibacter sp.]